MSDCGCETPQPDCGTCGTKSRRKLWRILAGATFTRPLKIRKRKTGGSFDLTGYGVRAWFRKVKFDYAANAVQSVCTIIDAATGRVDLVLGAMTTRMMCDTGYFDVEVYKLDDPEVVYRVLQGEYRVDLEVTTL